MGFKYQIRNDGLYFLDEQGEFFDTTHFPPSLEKYPFRGRCVYCLDGKVAEEFGFPSLEVYFLKLYPKS